MVIPKRRSQLLEENVNKNFEFSQRKENKNVNTSNKENNLIEMRMSIKNNPNRNSDANLNFAKQKEESFNKKVSISDFNMKIENQSQINSNSIPHVDNLIQIENSQFKENKNEEPNYLNLMEESDVSNHNKNIMSNREIINFNTECKTEEEKKNVELKLDINKINKIKTKSRANFMSKSSHFELNEIEENVSKIADTPTNSLKSGSFDIKVVNRINLDFNYFFIFKISSIFTILQISDIILYNILLMNLLLFENTFTITEISLFLSFFHLIYSFISPIINTCIVGNFFKKIFKLKMTFNISVFISIFFTLITVIYDKLKIYCFGDDLNLGIIILIILILIRNLSLTSSLTCYNLLVFNINNSKIKQKIQEHQNYISFFIKTLAGFLSCYFYDYFFTNIVISILVLAFIQILLLICSFKLIEDLVKIL